MPIEEKNEKCIRFYTICGELMERYRRSVFGEKLPTESKRDRALDEVMRGIMFLVDVEMLDD